MKKFVGEHQVWKECQSCCIDDSAPAQPILFSSARLRVCSWKLGRYPAVHDFVSNRAHRFPKLHVEYARGADPELILMGENVNEAADTVSIGSWTVDNMEAFLKEKLAP